MSGWSGLVATPYDHRVSIQAAAPPYVARPLALHPFRGLLLTPTAGRRLGSPRGHARPYRDVARRIERALATGHVTEDADEALYLHEYTAGGLTVRGLVGALDVSRRAHSLADRAVLPHEGVIESKVTRLAAHMRALAVNPAPILLVHRGTPELRRCVDRAVASTPAWDYTDGGGQRQRLWPVTDPGLIEQITGALAHGHAVIADGHHRYAAYLALHDEFPGTGWDRGLAMLVDQNDTPLFLGAIHRVLRGLALSELRDVAAADPATTVVDCGHQEALAALAPATVVATDGTGWLALRIQLDPHEAIVQHVHERWFPALTKSPPRIRFHHAVEDTLADVRQRPGTALLMPAPDFDLVNHIVARDRLLPEKATSFQPKPHMGVIMRRIRDA